MLTDVLCFALGFGAARVPVIRDWVDDMARAGWNAVSGLLKNRSNK